jgi:hypothetical protein
MKYETGKSKDSMRVTQKRVLQFLEQSLNELARTVSVAERSWGKTTISRGDSGWGLRYSSKRQFIDKILPFLFLPDRFSSIKQFGNSLAQDSRLKQWIKKQLENKAPTGIRQLQPDWISTLLLRDFLQQLDGLIYDPGVAIQTAKAFLRLLDEGVANYIDYSVVRGLEADFKADKLPGGIQLRRLDDDELCKLIDRNDSLVTDDGVPSNTCFLEYRIPISFVEQSPVITKASEGFDEIIRALRLLKDGRVERQIIYRRVEHLGQLGIFEASAGALNKRTPISGTYSLLQSDISNLKEVLKMVKRNPRASGSLRIAVDRFNFAAERERPEDQLLDLMIAAEALFGDAGEVGYKVRMRCAVFVGTDHESRDNIAKLIQSAYGLRSALVHGYRKSGDSVEIVNGLQSLVRKSINRVREYLKACGMMPENRVFDELMLHSKPSSKHTPAR